MNLLDDSRCLTKKRDYQAILSGFKHIYGKDRRQYPNLIFNQTLFEQYLANHFQQRYGNPIQTHKYFQTFWQTFQQWFSNQQPNQIDVATARETIVLFMQYDFQTVSNIEYF